MGDRSNISFCGYAAYGDNIGSGTTIYAGNCGVKSLQFKSISVLGSLSINSDSENIIISGNTGNTQNIDGKLDITVFSAYTGTTYNILTGITGNTVDNLNSNILSYNVTNKTYEPYSGFSGSELIIYTATTFTCPTGLTRVGINGRLVVTELRVSTGNTNTTHNVGDVFWDNSDQTMAIQQSPNVTQQIGQENYVLVKNNTGVGVNNGTVVYIDGADGDRPTIKLARASAGDGNVVGAIVGIVTEDIPDGEIGYVTSFGLVKGLNLTDPAGTPLYVSTTNSGFTQTTKPVAPDYAIKIGIITKTDGIDGRILVSVTDETDITGVTYTANNGITKVGYNFVLGGSLTGNTTLNGDSNSLSVTGLSSFHVSGNSASICSNNNVLGGPTCACGIFYPNTYNCVDVSCSGLPVPGTVTGGMIYISDAQIMAWSNGSDWINFATANPI